MHAQGFPFLHPSIYQSKWARDYFEIEFKQAADDANA